MNKTFRALFLFSCILRPRSGTTVIVRRLPSFVGRRLLQSSRSPAAPRARNRAAYVIRNFLHDYCICKRPVLLEMCIVFPRARRACNKNTPVQHTITQSANCRDQCSVTAEITPPPVARPSGSVFADASVSSRTSSLHVHVHLPPPCSVHLSRSPF